jgi:hypothetical protein
LLVDMPREFWMTMIRRWSPFCADVLLMADVAVQDRC